MILTMRNPIDMTRPAASLVAALDDATRLMVEQAIYRAVGDLYVLVRDNCIGSGEVVRVDWDVLTLVGPVEQNGALAGQPGHIVVNVLPAGADPKPEFERIARDIWGPYLEELRRVRRPVTTPQVTGTRHPLR